MVDIGPFCEMAVFSQIVPNQPLSAYCKGMESRQFLSSNPMKLLIILMILLGLQQHLLNVTIMTQEWVMEGKGEVMPKGPEAGRRSRLVAVLWAVRLWNIRRGGKGIE